MNHVTEERTPNGLRGGVLRRVALNLAVLVGAVLVFSGAMELALRVAFHRSLDFSMEMWKYAVELKHPEANPQLSFSHAPNTSAFLMGVPVSINSHGLRDREYSLEKPPGVYRIVMSGDSTTFGWGAPVEQTAAKILERRLNQTCASGHSCYEVLNAGVGNYGTVQEYTHYIAYDRAFHPDLVILEYFINDPEPVPAERHPGLIGRSYLVAFMASRFDLVMRLTGLRPNWKEYYAGLYGDDRPGMRAAQKALKEWATATRADGTQLLVTILPELHQINDGYPFTREQQKILDTLEANHVPSIDLIDGLRGHGPETSLWVTPADDHPNGKANALIVDQLMPWVLRKSKKAATQP